MNIGFNPVAQQQLRASSKKSVSRPAIEAAPQFAGGGERPAAKPLSKALLVAALGIGSLFPLAGGGAQVRAQEPAKATAAREAAIAAYLDLGSKTNTEIAQDARDNYRLATYLTQLSVESQIRSLQEIVTAESDTAKAAIKDRVVSDLKTTIGYTELAKYTQELAEAMEKGTRKEDKADPTHIATQVNLSRIKQTVQLATDAQTAQINAAIENQILSKNEVQELLTSGKDRMELFQKQDPALQKMVFLNSLASFTGIEATKSYAYVGQIAVTEFNSKMKSELRTISRLADQSTHFQTRANALLSQAKSNEAKVQIQELLKPLEVSVNQITHTRKQSAELAKKMGFSEKEITEIMAPPSTPHHK